MFRIVETESLYGLLSDKERRTCCFFLFSKNQLCTAKNEEGKLEHLLKFAACNHQLAGYVKIIKICLLIVSNRGNFAIANEINLATNAVCHKFSEQRNMFNSWDCLQRNVYMNFSKTPVAVLAVHVYGLSVTAQAAAN